MDDKANAYFQIALKKLRYIDRYLQINYDIKSTASKIRKRLIDEVLPKELNEKTRGNIKDDLNKISTKEETKKTVQDVLSKYNQQRDTIEKLETICSKSVEELCKFIPNDKDVEKIQECQKERRVYIDVEKERCENIFNNKLKIFDAKEGEKINISNNKIIDEIDSAAKHIGLKTLYHQNKTFFLNFIEDTRLNIEYRHEDDTFWLRIGYTGWINDNLEALRSLKKQFQYVDERSNNIIYTYFIQPADKLLNNPNAREIIFKKMKEVSYIMKTIDNHSAMTKYINALKFSKNIILHGAPGTGKTYTARQIASELIYNNTDEDSLNTLKSQPRFGFVQFHPSYDYTDFVEGLRPVQNESNNGSNSGFALYPGIFKQFCDKARNDENPDHKYVFIIDEINRGDISKIFGELFFSIDPGYRGEAGAVKTQYANLHTDGEQDFYVPKNVFIIATMNDIDRSVESFDFAMRRRFRFIEVTAKDSQTMLDSKIKNDELCKRIKKVMDSLNTKIEMDEHLGIDYQIGASYFLQAFNNVDTANETSIKNAFDSLWSDQLEPLLHEYLRGVCNPHELKDILKDFKASYDSDANKDKGLKRNNEDGATDADSTSDASEEDNEKRK